MNQREINTFTVQEYHRGEWSDLIIKDKDGKRPKTVKISNEHAKLLSHDAEVQAKENKRTSMFRYVLKGKKVKEKVEKKTESKGDNKKAREDYKKVFGKKAFGGWSIEQLEEKIKNK